MQRDLFARMYDWEAGLTSGELAHSHLDSVGSAVRHAFCPDEDSVERIIVVHSQEDMHLAFADRCMHNAKELYYLPQERGLKCHSGRSHFDLDGDVIKGPAEGVLHGFAACLEAAQPIIDMGASYPTMRKSPVQCKYLLEKRCV